MKMNDQEMSEKELGEWTVETDLLGYWEMDMVGHPSIFKVARQHKKAFRNLQRALRHLGVVVNKVEIEDYFPPPQLIDPVPVSTEGQATLRVDPLQFLPPPFVGGDHILLLDVSFPPKYVAAVRELSHVTSVTSQEERCRTSYVRSTVYPKSPVLEFFHDVMRVP